MLSAIGLERVSLYTVKNHFTKLEYIKIMKNNGNKKVFLNKWQTDLLLQQTVVDHVRDW